MDNVVAWLGEVPANFNVGEKTFEFWTNFLTGLEEEPVDLLMDVPVRALVETQLPWSFGNDRAKLRLNLL